jgi:hypothetical protein
MKNKLHTQMLLAASILITNNFLHAQPNTNDDMAKVEAKQSTEAATKASKKPVSKQDSLEPKHPYNPLSPPVVCHNGNCAVSDKRVAESDTAQRSAGGSR